MSCGKCKVCKCGGQDHFIFEDENGHHAYTEDGVIVEGDTEQEVKDKLSERGQLNG